MNEKEKGDRLFVVEGVVPVGGVDLVVGGECGCLYLSLPLMRRRPQRGYGYADAHDVVSFQKV